ncbi:MAG: endonuclease III [Prevotella sp.]|nr:endonuclease III [Prevotella sp.]
MKRSERYRFLLDYYKKEMPEVTTELQFGSVFQLLVATLLSAQCTDKRINQVTPELFRRYPDAKAMSEAEESEIFEYIKSVSYPNAKAHHLSEMSKMIIDKFGGNVPAVFEDLVTLPGVGRKTANVVEAVAFGKAAMAVDTHVFRVSHRLGLVPKSATTPYLVEKELVKNIPDDIIPKAHHWILLHGRYICTSRKPHCEKCPFDDICPKNNV